MKRFALAAFAAAALALLGFATPASACCVPCASICPTGVPGSTVCCTGIPVPGDACGHSTCRAWRKGQIQPPAEIASVFALDSTPAFAACEPAELFAANASSASNPSNTPEVR